jgi:diguanylate cyclase (GGDEF)-like protein
MTNKAKRYIAGSVFIWLMVVVASAIWNVSQNQNSQLQTYLENGRSLFNLIVITREWNAQQGGVYLPVTDKIQPNPYLDVSNRDVTTTSGQKLTLINPAYMTRLIAELADEKDNVKFHITSLNPIRLLNAPTKWESFALESFENRGQQEYYEYDYDDQKTLVFRYMAPLVTGQSCLNCHEKQGYQLGNIRGGISISFPVKIKTPWALIISHIIIALAGGGLIFVYGIKLNKTMQTLEDLSNLDGLTQIYNRRYFEETLVREFLYSKRNKAAMSVAMCDIDDFKAFNDTYGHQAGDYCLKQVAQTLNRVLKRPGDLVARYGGEEFCIILPYTDSAGALLVGQLLQSKIESLQIPHRASKVSNYLTVSIGIATSHGDDINGSALVNKADQSLYKAKASGKNCVTSMENTVNESSDL